MSMFEFNDPRDAYNFRLGMTLVHGDWRSRLRSWFERRTRWFRPRHVVIDVDVKAGLITMATERWSWRRWRWER